MTLHRTIRWAALAAALALGAVLAAGGQALGAAARPDAQGLIEFETAVNWSAVAPRWRGRRPSWLRQVASATQANAVGRLTVELETAMGWPSVQPSWRQARPGWVRRMKNATSAAQVARGLLELEAATKWSAVNQSWKQKRPGWVARMRRLAGL